MMFLLLVFPLVTSESCRSVGKWAAWSEWTSCPLKRISLMNFRARIRNCYPQPENCEAVYTYYCPGTYSEVTYCEKNGSETTMIKISSSAMTTSTVLTTMSSLVLSSSISSTLREMTTMNRTMTPLETITIMDEQSTPMNLRLSSQMSNTTMKELSTMEGTRTTMMKNTTETMMESTAAETISPSTTPVVSLPTTNTNLASMEPKSTIKETIVKCNDCEELNIQLFDGSPYEDGASVLSRYSMNNCKFTEFLCRAYEMGDKRPVQIVFNGDISIANSSSSVQMACKNGQWYDSQTGIAVVSVSCIYESLLTTTTVREPAVPEPGDPYVPCMKCSRDIIVAPKIGQEGSAYTDFRATRCMTVLIYCQPTKTIHSVELLMDGKSVGIVGKSLNRTLLCMNGSMWMDSVSLSIVGSVSCLMINGVPSTSGFEPSTVVRQTIYSTPSSSPGSTIDTGLKVELATTGERRVTLTTTSQPNTAQTSTNRERMPSTSGVEPTTVVGQIFHSTTSSSSGSTTDPGLKVELTTAEEKRVTLTTTSKLITQQASTDRKNGCFTCSNLVGSSISQAESYNGMVTLYHTTDSNGCKTVEVHCVPTKAGEIAILYVNGMLPITSGRGRLSMKISCSNEGKWVIGEEVHTSNVSCLVQNYGKQSIPLDLSIQRSTTVIPSPLPPGVEPCMSCPTLLVVPLTTFYTNGFTTLVSSISGGCETIQLTCEGNKDDDELVLVINGTEYEKGVGALRMTLVCNKTMTWTTSSGVVVPQISCGVKTTKCDQCANLQPVEVRSLATDEANGLLILDHITNASHCRAVEMRCFADKDYENATLLLNGSIELTSAPTYAYMSLTCSPDGKWMVADKEISSTSCRITKGPENQTVYPPPLTSTSTTTAAKTGSDPCSNCNRMLVTSAPTGYTNGFVTMHTYYNGSCINIELTCLAPKRKSEVAWIGPLGENHTDVAGKTNLKLACNKQTKWLTPSGATVESLSCASKKEASLMSLDVSSTTALTMVSTGLTCERSRWTEWKEWSNCTDFCGACGTRQRFRECSTTEPECRCNGTSSETEVCNKEVCKYPRPTCCSGYTPSSFAGRFYCMKPT
ncbi:hypothetical protein Angca_000754 [Angiostrongylus cantonensis]|nr:hypothetical protein Angca_000754 [Angiostrongylus cantonensis]